MPQPLMPKKLKLNSSMLTYKTFRTNTKKYVLFLIGDWNPKVGNQELPGVTDQFFLGVQNEAGQSLTEFCQEKTLVIANSLVIANTLFQQHKRRLYTWTSSGGQYQNQIDYILCREKLRSSIHSGNTRLGGEGGSDHELLAAKIKVEESRENH